MKEYEKKINSLQQIIESQQQTARAILNKYEQLEKAFEELVVEKCAIKELRDFWRERAGTIKPPLQNPSAN